MVSNNNTQGKMIHLLGKLRSHSLNNLTEIWNGGTNYKYGSGRPKPSNCISEKNKNFQMQSCNALKSTGHRIHRLAI